MSCYSSVQLPLNQFVERYEEPIKREVLEYLETLDEHHKKAYMIVYEYLGSSFNIARSNGFKEWKASKTTS